MTKAEAHALLDAARAGALVSRPQIDAALRVTGDLLPLQLHPRHDAPGELLPSQLQARDAPLAWQPSPDLLQVGTRVVSLRFKPYSGGPQP